MRERVLHDLNKPTRKPNKPPIDFDLLMDEDEAFEAFDMLRNYNILGSGGGWFDQSEAYQQAVTTLMTLYGEEMRAAKREDERKPGSKLRSFDEATYSDTG